MQDNYRKNNGTQPDPQLVNTVVAVIQAMQSNQGEDAQAAQVKKSQGNDNAPKTIDLIGLMFYVLEKFWIVLLAAIIAASVLGHRAGQSVATYTATAKLYIVDANSTEISYADLQIGNALTMDYQEVFYTWEVHEMVRNELNLPYSYDQMQRFLSVSNPEDTRVLYLTVTYFDAQMAADIANAYARAAKEFIMNAMHGEMPSDFSIALVPSVARVTSRTGALIKGFMLGSVLAVGVLTLLFVLDDRPRTPEDIATYGGIPTLAVLPSTKQMKRKRNRRHKYYRKGRREHEEA